MYEQWQGAVPALAFHNAADYKHLPQQLQTIFSRNMAQDVAF
jgi:TRAP-type mannitol/chloroaromatic compound transport system substrate-binding protein